jgi:hypothetical protein
MDFSFTSKNKKQQKMDLSAFYQEQLNVLNKYIDELHVEPTVKQKVLNIASKHNAIQIEEIKNLDFFHLKEKVLQLEKSQKWERAVKNGLVENIQKILDENTYQCFCDEFSKSKSIFGEFNSVEWKMFLLNIITKLKKNDSFLQECSEEYDTFEDTAGGCDEIVWDVGCSFLN